MSRFDHYVINIDGDCWFWPLDLVRLVERVDLVGEASLHALLIGGASILQTEQHCDVVEQFEGGDERCHELVGLFHRNLMVPGVRIKEAEGFAPRGRVKSLVYARQRKRVLWACLVETRVVNTHPPFPTLLSYKNGIG